MGCLLAQMCGAQHSLAGSVACRRILLRMGLPRTASGRRRSHRLACARQHAGWGAACRVDVVYQQMEGLLYVLGFVATRDAPVDLTLTIPAAVASDDAGATNAAAVAAITYQPPSSECSAVQCAAPSWPAASPLPACLHAMHSPAGCVTLQAQLAGWRMLAAPPLLVPWCSALQQASWAARAAAWAWARWAWPTLHRPSTTAARCPSATCRRWVGGWVVHLRGLLPCAGLLFVNA